MCYCNFPCPIAYCMNIVTTKPIIFSYSFFASSLLIPDRWGNATVASILPFLKKTSKVLFFPKNIIVRKFFSTADLRLLATLVCSLTLSLASSLFLLWSTVNRSISWNKHFWNNHILSDNCMGKVYDIHQIPTCSLYEGSTEIRDMLKTNHKPLWVKWDVLIVIISTTAGTFYSC